MTAEMALVLAAEVSYPAFESCEVGRGEVEDWTLRVEPFRAGCRRRMFGAGKLDFLSIASTVLWKRRNKASARTRVLSRFIVVESSLTMQ